MHFLIIKVGSTVIILIIFLIGLFLGFLANNMFIKKIFRLNVKPYKKESNHNSTRNILIKEQKDIFGLFKSKLKDFEYSIESKNKELEEKERKQKKILDSLSEGIYQCSSDFKIEYLNKGMTNIIGYNALNETCYRAIYGYSEKCSSCSFDKLEDKKETSHEIYNKKLKKYFFINNILLNNGSKLSIFYDISARKIDQEKLKLSELKYKTLIEDSSIGVALFKDKTIIYSNDSLARIFGFKKAIELTDRDIFDFLAESSQLKISKRLEKIQNGEFVSPDLIIKIKRENNSIRTVKLRVSDILINEDKLRHATFMDITEQIEADKELKKSQKDLKSNLVQKDKFFSIIAHDLKNPLNSLMGFIELLKYNHKKYEHEKRGKFIDLIYNNAKNINSLLENLLVWSRSQRGLLDAKPEDFNLSDQVNACINLFKNALIQKKITISNNLKTDLHVEADKNMLNTILRNLISNAIKFTEKNGEIKTYATIIKNNNYKYAEITIEDNGVGIEKEILPKLFTINQNHSTEGTNNEPGTGLGLILCKEFVEKNGGTIHAESSVGKGSKFVFTIPVILKK